MLPFSLVYHDGFYLPLGAHVFPGEKYRLVHERLLTTGAAAESDFVRPETIALEDVLRVHEAGYIERLIDGTLSEAEILQMELPYSKALVDATLLGCGGTLQAARLALRDGAACAPSAVDFITHMRIMARASASCTMSRSRWRGCGMMAPSSARW